MSHRVKEFWAVVAAIAFAFACLFGLRWLWHTHPWIILGALFGFGVLAGIVAGLADLTTPHRPNSDAEANDRTTAGFVAGTIVGRSSKHDADSHQSSRPLSQLTASLEPDQDHRRASHRDNR